MIFRLKGFQFLFLIFLLLWGCGSDSDKFTYHSRDNTKNVIYKHGDMMKYDAEGTYTHADGSKTIVTGGWLRLEIMDEGLTNPLNNNIPVLSLIEAQSYDAKFVDPNGKETPSRIVNYLYRYFVHDPLTGTIKYQGEKLIDGYDSMGNPIWKTYWFEVPRDYIQYQMPLNVNDTRQTDYFKRTEDGSSTLSGKLVTVVEAREDITIPLGRFDTFRMRYTDTSTDPGMEGLISDRLQYIYPDVGIIKFVFYSTTPGDTGIFTLTLSDTNIPFRGDNRYALSTDDKLTPNVPGYLTRYERSGFYMSDYGTVEEISGWFTMEILDETVLNPILNRTLNTMLETHYTEIRATDIVGNTTTTIKQEAFKRYFYLGENDAVAFAGDTGPAGTLVAGMPIWFDEGFIPMDFPYFVGQTKSQTINVFAYMDGQAIPLYSFTPSMEVVSIIDVSSKLGTFECYLMTYLDTEGKTVEQYSYPKLGVAKFRYPAPAGKIGYMDLTVSETNVPYK